MIETIDLQHKNSEKPTFVDLCFQLIQEQFILNDLFGRYILRYRTVIHRNKATPYWHQNKTPFRV